VRNEGNLFDKNIVISKEDSLLTLMTKKTNTKAFRSARIEMVYRFSGDNGSIDKAYVYQTERKSSNEEASLTIQIAFV
jgi:hypothetical protein